MPTGAAILTPRVSLAPPYAQHLADGEIVILALKPSFWFVFLKRAGWLATLAILWSLMALVEALGWWDFQLYPLGMAFIIGAVAVLAWLTLDRLTRLYLLTDKRILRVSGIFSRTSVEIPLQKVTTVVLHRTFTERLTGVGSILFTSAASGDGGGGDLVWFIIDRPVTVVRTVRETLARYGGGPPPSAPSSPSGNFGAAQ